MMQLSLMSIVTPSHSQARFLEETIGSILFHGYPTSGTASPASRALHWHLVFGDLGCRKRILAIDALSKPK
jgi:hypothetical protein